MKAPCIISWPVSGRPAPDAVDKVVAALRRGALVVLPTDTVYGVAALPQAPGAVARIFKAKNRPRERSIALLAADCRQVEKAGGELDAASRALAARYWPGALTMVLKTGRAWEGFRVPNHPVTLAILKAVGSVLRVTSANISGEPPARTAGSAVKALRDAVELVVDAGPSPGSLPSTVVKIEMGRCRILREGPVPAAEIIKLCRAVEDNYAAL